MTRRAVKAYQQRTSKDVSSGSGGPANLRGVNFQLSFATLKALELIRTAKNAPHKRCHVTIEPRCVGGTVTAWDIEVSPPDCLIEAKLAPTAADTKDYLVRLRDARAAGSFVLICGKKRGTLLADVEILSRIAQECGEEVTKFEALVKAQHVLHASEIIAMLGSNYLSLLNRVIIEDLSEAALRRQLDFCAGLLAATRAEDVIDHIFRKFSEAGEKRLTIEIGELLAELESRNIPIYAAAEINLSNERPDLAGTLFLLQRCPLAVPRCVIEEGIEVAPAAFDILIEELRQEKVLVIERDLIRLNPLPTQVLVQDHKDLVARALKSLIDYIKTGNDLITIREQTHNVLALAEISAITRPKTVIHLFERLQSVLKAMGDKRLILRLADLSLEAANRLGNDEEAAESRALTLVCGKSWVYQRIGRLDEAMLLAEKSLALGELIPWPKNTAFCTKCIGRMRRLQAERAASGPEKVDLLRQSAETLQTAIDLFEHLPERGPAHPDTGDCYSLMGRTYLASGRLDLADSSIQKAFELIPAGVSKDYMDLKILAGDLESERKNFDSAEGHYTDVLAILIVDDHEKSEILARAHLQRGIVKKKMGRTDGARLDFDAARHIWGELGESRRAAEAEWEQILLTTRIPKVHISMFASEGCCQTRVRAFRVYESRLVNSKGALALRERPPAAQVLHLLMQARREVAMEPEW